MKKTSLKYILSLLFISLAGCQSDEDVLGPQVNSIFGRWEWIRSVGGLAGLTRTPASEGYQMDVEITPAGKFRTFRNGELLNESEYTIKKGNSIVLNAETEILDLGENAMKYSFTVVNYDTLYLNEECVDCFSHVYKRKL